MFRILLASLMLTTFALADERNFQIVFDRTMYKNNAPELIKSFDASISHRNNHSFLNGFVVFRKRIHQLDLISDLNFYRTNSQRVTVYDVRYDGCQLFKFMGANKLLAKFFQIFIDTINELPSCPLKANFNYTLTDYTVREDFFPNFMPEGKVVVTNRFILNKTVAFYMSMQCRIVKKKNRQ